MTVHLAVFPLLVFAVIVIFPTFFAVIFPFLSTEAILPLLLVHVIFFSVTVFGSKVAINLSDFPVFNDNVVLFNFIEFGLVLTLIIHLAIFLLVVVAFTVTVPFAFAVTVPFESTVAILV